MPLVPLVDESRADATDLPALEAGRAAYGQLLNTWRAIANRPGLFATYLPFLRTVAGPGTLDQAVKELTAVRVGVLNHCRYTVSHRCASAQAQGLTTAQLGAVATGDFDGFDDRTRAALALTDEMTLDLPQTPLQAGAAGVDPAVLADVQRHFAPDALTELLMSIAVWNALSRFHRVMEFDLDMPEPPPEVAAVL